MKNIFASKDLKKKINSDVVNKSLVVLLAYMSLVLDNILLTVVGKYQ